MEIIVKMIAIFSSNSTTYVTNSQSICQYFLRMKGTNAINFNFQYSGTSVSANGCNLSQIKVENKKKHENTLLFLLSSMSNL